MIDPHVYSTVLIVMLTRKMIPQKKYVTFPRGGKGNRRRETWGG